MNARNDRDAFEIALTASTQCAEPPTREQWKSAISAAKSCYENIPEIEWQIGSVSAYTGSDSAEDALVSAGYHAPYSTLTQWANQASYAAGTAIMQSRHGAKATA